MYLGMGGKKGFILPVKILSVCRVVQDRPPLHVGMIHIQNMIEEFFFRFFFMFYVYIQPCGL